MSVQNLFKNLEDTAVFAAIEKALRTSYQHFGHQVLVAKFIPEHFADIGPLT